MWNLQITDEISLVKNKKLNILQIGFSNNEYTIWLLNNIMKNNNSKLYILNLWYQSEKNQEMTNDKSIIKFFKKEDGDNFFFKDLRPYSSKIINIKKKSVDMFNFCYKEKIQFDLIFIDLQFLTNILSYLISSLELLSESGILILININLINENILQTFINAYQKNIKISRVNNIILLKKKIESKNKTDLPLYFEEIFYKYLAFEEYNIKKNIPKINLKNIFWDFKINNYYYDSMNKDYGYNYEIEKYKDFIYDIKDSMYNKLKKMDINYFMIYRPKKTKNYLQNYKQYDQKELEKIKKILNLDKYFKFDKMFLKSNIKIGKKKINLFTLSGMQTNSEYFKYNSKYNNFYETYLSTKKKKIGKNTLLIKSNNKNLLDLKNIFSLSQKHKSKFNLIKIFLNRYIIFNSNIDFYKYYSNILLLNILYLILNIQNKNGELFFMLPPLTNNVQLQILQILSNYYKTITLDTYFNYSNYYSIEIHASDFKGITKQELDDFYNNYYSFYEKNIEPHIEEMFSGKKIEGLYLDNIISNKLDKKLIKVVSDFNKQYYKEFLNNLKMKIDLYDFLHNKTTTKQQKDYIYDKLFQTQYKRFVEESRKLYGKKSVKA